MGRVTAGFPDVCRPWHPGLSLGSALAQVVPGREPPAHLSHKHTQAEHLLKRSPNKRGRTSHPSWGSCCVLKDFSISVYLERREDTEANKPADTAIDPQASRLTGRSRPQGVGAGSRGKADSCN